MVIVSILFFSKDVIIPEVLVRPLTPSDHYYVSFTIEKLLLHLGVRLLLPGDVILSQLTDLICYGHLKTLKKLKQKTLVSTAPFRINQISLMN